jgi:uncharacterized protein
VALADKLTEDMKASMKAGNSARTGTIRLLRGAVKNEEIKAGQTLDDEGVLKVLQREAKQRRDSIEAYRAAGRDDLVAHEEAELAVVNEYLPQALSEAELAEVVRSVIAATGATGMAQMGAVMGATMQQVGARADGAAVARIVREQLAT